MKKFVFILTFILLPLFASAETVEIDGIYYNIITKGQIAEVTENPKQYAGNIVIPSKVTYNGVECDVTKIGDRAFYSCRSLKSITLKKSVSEIGEHSFQYCSNLISVSIPNSVTTIDSHAFSDCSSLKSIDIPESVVNIGDGVFNGCTTLESISLPNKINKISSGLFSGCSSLKKIEIPYTVTSIKSQAFYGCKNLTNINIPNNVLSIEWIAFSDCSSLETINVSNSIKTIGPEAFKNCSNLKTVYCNAETIPSLNSTAFDGSYIEYVTLYVPIESIDNYKANSEWGQFGTILPIEGEEQKEKCTSPSIAFNNGELIFTCSTENAEIQYNYSISSTGSGSTNSDAVKPVLKLIVNAWATADGYETSDTTTATFDVTQPSTGMKGDVNQDKKVDISDVVAVINIMAGNTE